MDFSGRDTLSIFANHRQMMPPSANTLNFMAIELTFALVLATMRDITRQLTTGLDGTLLF